VAAPARTWPLAGSPTVNSAGWNDGLLYFDPNFATDHNYAVYPTKRFYTLA